MWGFVAAAVVGVGGGIILGPLGRNMAPQSVTNQLPPQIVDHRVRIERVRGVAKIRGADGRWRTASAGQTIARPIGIKTVGIGSEILVAQKQLRFLGAHDSKFYISAPSSMLSVQLERGLMLVLGQRRPVNTYIPSRQITASGGAYGVWVGEKDVKISVLDGTVDVKTIGKEPVQYAKGREIVMTSKGIVPSVLPSKLALKVSSTKKSGREYRVSGKTSPNALVALKTKDRVKEVSVSSSGSFSASLGKEKPGMGELVAYDSAGRRAEIGKDSRTLDALLGELRVGGARADPVQEKSAIMGLAPPKKGKASAKSEKKAAPPVKVEKKASSSSSKKEKRTSESSATKKKKEKKKETARKASTKTRTRGDDTPELVKVKIEEKRQPPDVTTIEKPEVAAPTEAELKKAKEAAEKKKKKAEEAARKKKAKEAKAAEPEEKIPDDEDDDDIDTDDL